MTPSQWLRPLYVCLWVLIFSGCAENQSPAMPYDKLADPFEQLESLTRQARETDKSILLVFGANWCQDCRRLARLMRTPEMASTLRENFLYMNVDVGNWDHNEAFVQQWGDPIEGGIPAVVVTNQHHEVVYASAAGELSTARRMGPQQLQQVFERMAATTDG